MDDDEQEDSSSSQGYHIKCGFILLTYNDDKLADWTCPDLQLALAEQLDTCRFYTIAKERGARDHFHVAAEAKKQFNHKLSYWAVNGVSPSDVRCNKVKGSGARRSRDRGHFYCACKYKNTHIAYLTNYEPAHDYQVVLNWIEALWAQAKINDEDVIPCAAHYNCLTPNFAAKVKICIATNLKVAKDEATAARAKRLKAARSEFKQYAVATEWREQYVREADRYKFLVVYGRSNLGKSQMCYSWFKKPFLHKDQVSWLDYPDDCDAIIFEDIPDVWDYIEAHKSMFQASGVVKVNVSRTDMYSQPIDLTQKPLIITTNEWRGTHWTDANCYTLKIDDVTWVTR